MISEPVRLDEFVERRYGERRVEHKRQRRQEKETEKSSGTGSRVPRAMYLLGSNAAKNGYLACIEDH